MTIDGRLMQPYSAPISHTVAGTCADAGRCGDNGQFWCAQVQGRAQGY